MEIKAALTALLLSSLSVLILSVNTNSSASRLLTIHSYHAFSSLNVAWRGLVRHLYILCNQLNMDLPWLVLKLLCLLIFSVTFLRLLAVMNLTELLIGPAIFHFKLWHHRLA